MKKLGEETKRLKAKNKKLKQQVAIKKEVATSDPQDSAFNVHRCQDPRTWAKG